MQSWPFWKALRRGSKGSRAGSVRDLDAALRPRKANAFWFKDDGVIPNNPKLPLVLYRSPVRLSGKFDPAAVFEELFERNGWGDSWRNGIYDYEHYHSRIHEVLGIARGHARVRLGGAKGRALKLKAGDVMILPPGTGHERLSGSKDLLVVGGYPPSARMMSGALCAHTTDEGGRHLIAKFPNDKPEVMPE